MTNGPVYLDNNATTKAAPEVVDAMVPYLGELYGNPSSPHSFARPAALAVDDARKKVARILGVEPGTITFTSGGTESNAMALLGSLPAMKPRNEIIMSAVEHPAIWAWQDRLIELGYVVHVIGVDRQGALDIAALEKKLSENTALVTVMAANNETGVLFPVKDIAELAHRVGALMHTDIVQAVGKITVNLAEWGVDLATTCCHKHHGPKGIGALYVRDPGRFRPLMLGGEQESGRRPGTEPVPLLAGFGKAEELAAAWLAEGGHDRMRTLRDDFEGWLKTEIPDIEIAGADTPRLPNTTMALIDGVDAEPLLACLDMEGIACSSGSACSSGAHEPSHVLRAMGVDRDSSGRLRGILRVSAGRFTTAPDYARLKTALPKVVDKLRSK